MTLTEEILSQLPKDVLSGLRRADRLLTSIREDSAPIPQVVKQSQLPLGTVDCNVVVSGVKLSQLKLQRALFGFFPSYRHLLRTPWSRILQVGDSSSNQSPFIKLKLLLINTLYVE